MAITYLSKKEGGSVTIHVSVANASIVVAGNTSQSNIAVASETVTGATIRRVAWGTDAGSIQIKRSGNLIATYSGSGDISYAAMGAPLTMLANTDIAVEFSGTANGYLVFELGKRVA